MEARRENHPPKGRTRLDVQFSSAVLEDRSQVWILHNVGFVLVQVALRLTMLFKVELRGMLFRADIHDVRAPVGEFAAEHRIEVFEAG